MFTSVTSVTSVTCMFTSVTCMFTSVTCMFFHMLTLVKHVKMINMHVRVSNMPADFCHHVDMIFFFERACSEWNMHVNMEKIPCQHAAPFPDVTKAWSHCQMHVASSSTLILVEQARQPCPSALTGRPRPPPHMDTLPRPPQLRRMPAVDAAIDAHFCAPPSPP
jgi:hypothetical protein